MIDTQKCYFNYERAARFGKIQQWLCLCQKRAMTSVSGKSGLNGRDELLIWLGQKYPSHKGFNLFFFSKSPLHHWYRFFLKNAIWYFWSILDFLYFCLYVLLSFYLSFFCLSFFLSFHVFVFPCFCLSVSPCFCLFIFCVVVFLFFISKDCLLKLVKSRLALGSPGWLVVRHQAKNASRIRKCLLTASHR